MRTAEQFWSKVDKGGACWVWTGARNSDGYGHLLWEGKLRKAHRVAWALLVGPLPDDTSTGARGTLLLHKCDNPPCVRPDHLFTGTQAVNIADAATKKRMRTGRYRGYQTKATKLTPEAAADIRRKVAGGTAQKALAAEYGVSKSTISLVVRNRAW